MGNNYDHLASLKDKEFTILEKLSKNDTTESEKNQLIKELEQVREEIARLR
ncbi:MAG: hypothetical protein XU09_C0006G0005 [Thaumarchaeota archaeon CSP1-1]|jgi:hypothetical protein|nr:MAG: hypothetical protein XU09_C0006G0005 [Thaumarchaeota archaeon CSP1-1]